MDDVRLLVEQKQYAEIVQRCRESEAMVQSSSPILLLNHLANSRTQLSYSNTTSPLFYATFILGHLLQNQLSPPLPSPLLFPYPLRLLRPALTYQTQC